ncbi:ABC transporter substrate-binding protein [Alteribacillus sp. YIM 98480]|uniref:ABC transporter substrate-binding protein n=1 Tax=Alteribacillus sp. YIM 98480 TaxID=2606599 RepID=UPI00131C9C82|nr:ABC transporter substrate-binding protein [Alteribacillus sp. YIM 98480]
MKRTIRMLLCPAVLMLFLIVAAACSSETSSESEEQTDTNNENQQEESEDISEGGTVTVAYDADPPTLDWMSSDSSATTIVSYHIFEQLFTLDEELTVQPMLAEDYEISDDGKVYTISLRSDVTFHDGSIMEAEDVVASLNRWGSISGIGMEVFSRVSEVKEVDESTVQIILDEPYGPLLSTMANIQAAQAVIPAEIAEAAGESPIEDDQLIGTGPFQFESWNRGDHITIKKFDDYVSREETDWGGLTGQKEALVDTVEFYVVSDAQVRIDGIRTGQYDYGIRIPQDLYEQLETDPSLELYPNSPDSWLTLVPDKSEPPFDNVKLRQALNYALDREEIGMATYGHPDFYQVDGAVFFPEQEDLYTTEGTEPYYEHNIEKAKELMEEAGYNGEPLKIIGTNSYDDHYNSGQIELEQLKKAGFNVEIQTYEWATYLENVEDPDNFDLFVTGFPVANDVSSLLWTSPSFPGWWESERMEEINEEWLESSHDPEVREKLLVELNELLYEDVPLLKIVNEVGLEVGSPQLQDYKPWLSMRFWNVGIAE